MKYEKHPLADLILPMDGDDFEQLKEDLKRNGQLKQIVLFEGKILCGWNRYRALEDLGIEPKVGESARIKDEQTAIQYIISDELMRRHMSAKDRVRLVLEYHKRIGVNFDTFTRKEREQIASTSGTSTGTVATVVKELNRKASQVVSSQGVLESTELAIQPITTSDQVRTANLLSYVASLEQAAPRPVVGGASWLEQHEEEKRKVLEKQKSERIEALKQALETNKKISNDKSRSRTDHLRANKAIRGIVNELVGYGVVVSDEDLGIKKEKPLIEVLSLALSNFHNRLSGILSEEFEVQCADWSQEQREMVRTEMRQLSSFLYEKSKAV